MLADGVPARFSISHSPEKNPYKRKPGDAKVMKQMTITVNDTTPTKHKAGPARDPPSSSDMTRHCHGQGCDEYAILANAV